MTAAARTTRIHPWRDRLLPAVVLSALAHAIVYGLMSGGGWAGVPDGGGGSGGDGGWGENLVEMTVAEAPTEPATPESPPEPEAETVEPEASERPSRRDVPRVEARAEEGVPVAAQSAGATEAGPSEAEPVPAGASEEADPAGERPSTTATEAESGEMGDPELRRLLLGAAGLGAGAERTRHGVLSEALVCDDLVEGVWEARKFHGGRDSWVRFRLHIERSGNVLHGTIRSRLWAGDRTQSTPPVCYRGAYDYTVRMRATGVAEGDHVTFGARSYQVQEAHCPSLGFGYNPDRFSGEVSPDGQELRARNNDGGQDVNEPYLFRRVSCEVD